MSRVVSNMWLGTSSRRAWRKPWNATKCIHHAGLLSVGLNSAPVDIDEPLAALFADGVLPHWKRAAAGRERDQPIVPVANFLRRGQHVLDVLFEEIAYGAVEGLRSRRDSTHVLAFLGPLLGSLAREPRRASIRRWQPGTSAHTTMAIVGRPFSFY